jgi:hypothetical protein
MVTAPEVAVMAIPLAPLELWFAEVDTVVPLMPRFPDAEIAAVTETAPLAGIMTSPREVVVVMELETVTAAPLIVTGPATDMEPPEMVTPDVFPDLPIRKLFGGPAIVKLVVLNVLPKLALDDSKTTAPVVRV